MFFNKRHIYRRHSKKIEALLPKLTALAAAALLLPALLALGTNSLGGWGELSGRIAVFSAVLAMPEGGAALIEEHLLPDEAEPAGDADEPEDDPAPDDTPTVIAPWPRGSSSGDGTPPEIEEAYRGSIVEEDMSGREGEAVFHPIGNGYLRNYTDVSFETIDDILSLSTSVSLDATTDEPQVLIYHTHATESYEQYDSEHYDTRGTWRSTDDKQNMVEVGAALARVLTESGIAVLHDTTQHDYPTYNGSYERSAKTVQQYLDEYPSIKVIFDVHRDAIEHAGNVIVKPTIEIDGKKAAQLMVIAPCDDNGSLGVPKWKENLRFANAIVNQIEADNPGLTRPIFFDRRKYNMNLSTGALLLEFGTHANTLGEAVYSAELAAASIAKLLVE